jgi:hypothetical protein
MWVHSITFSLDPRSISRAIKDLRKYRDDVINKCNLFTRLVGAEGFQVANAIMSRHIFSGMTFESLRFETTGFGVGRLVAESEALLFFEFGAGLNGGGHPLAGEMGYGPGTYPGSGNWDNPYGWWYPTDDPTLTVHTDSDGQGWAHSYGNPPRMPMYLASRAMRNSLIRVGMEVFGN